MMGYSKETYKEALKIITDAAKRKEKEYNLSLSAVYSAVPELHEIDRKLASLGASAVTAAMSGDMSKLEEFKKSSLDLQKTKHDILSQAGIKEKTFACTKCDDSGFVNGKLCDCVKSEAKKIAYKKMSADMPLDCENFDNFDLKYYSDSPEDNGVVPKKVMSAIFSRAKEYAKDFSKNSENLLFMGGVGLGKTHLCAAIIGEVIKKGYGVVYGSAQNLFSKVEKEHFSYDTQSHSLDALLNADLLVIDDLGAEFSTSFTQSLLYNIVNTRMNNGMPTVINTNLTLSELEQRYTSRVSSRLIGNYELFKFVGSDIRQQKKIAEIRK